MRPYMVYSALPLLPLLLPFLHLSLHLHQTLSPFVHLRYSWLTPISVPTVWNAVPQKATWLTLPSPFSESKL